MCLNVGLEPTLQPLTGESFPLCSTNTEEGARLDIKAQNFWDSSQRSTFFNVKVFNSFAPSNSSSSTSSTYHGHEREKKRAYEQRILQVEHGTFIPLVLSSSSGWGPSVTVPSGNWQASLPPSTDSPTVQPSVSSDARKDTHSYNQESCVCVNRDRHSMPLPKPSALKNTPWTSSARRYTCFD